MSWICCPVRPSVPEVAEDADTLIGNARLKATAICAATGLPAVSDDTGLFVDAIGGAPGIYAARFAGEDATYADNRAKLLRELGDTRNRKASFVSAVMVVWPDGHELAVEGVCEGTIATTELGDRGFGYDPVFIPDDGDGRSFAQMTDAEKNQISHRARAFARAAGCPARLGARRVLRRHGPVSQRPGQREGWQYCCTNRRTSCSNV